MNDSNAFRLLVVSDVHYAPSGAGLPAATHAGPCRQGCELVRRTIHDAQYRGGFDALVLLGDLLNAGEEPNAADAIEEILETIHQAAPDTPLLLIPGNHDYNGVRLPAGLPEHRYVRDLGGYRFVAFVDPYHETVICTRRESDRHWLVELAAGSDLPLVVLQHNPMHPVIDDPSYPFMLTNRQDVLDDYAAAGVLLSLSGHYHPGQSLNTDRGVAYFTVPAVCNPPFVYAMVSLHGREIDVERRSLALESNPPLVDTHAHTEFAYCTQDITAAEVLSRCELFGVSGVYLLEHAPQLYCTAEEFWQARHLTEPDLWRKGRHSRMPQFREMFLPMRSSSVRLGLEVEVDRDGQLTVRQEDRCWADLLVGAVHWLLEDTTGMTQARYARLFMDTTEKLLTAGVDVLAHPWRLFRQTFDRAGSELYVELAEMLAATDTAAEVNFHLNTDRPPPDPAFFAECVARGVKLALASDAHFLWEVAAFGPHRHLLTQVAGTNDISDLLFY